MICPQCQVEFPQPVDRCPECGVRIVQKISGIVKTSAVMIATADMHTFYNSVQDVPETLRRRLIETTNSENSGMIVIADRAGKEQWTEVVAQRESQQNALQARISEADAEHDAVTPDPARQQLAGLSWAAWAGILLFLAAGAMIASVFQVFHW